MTRAVTRTAFSLFLMMVLASLAFSGAAVAQTSDTVDDEAGVLTDAEEQQVQASFDEVQQETGRPLYASFVKDTNVDDDAARRDILLREASEDNVPQDAGIVVVAPNDGWGQTRNVPPEAYDAMRPNFADGDFAAGLVAGAEQMGADPAAAPTSDPGVGTGGPLGGILLLFAGLAAAALLLRNRRRSRQNLEDERGAAQEEFGRLTSRIDEFDEKERLVSGYLEAQRPLLDQETEGRVEALIEDARTSGFGEEFNEAAGRLTSDPAAARAKTQNGRRLLEGALEKLDLAEATIDDYRAADERLDGSLRTAADEVENAERAEEKARAAGVSVSPVGLRPEYDRLAKEAAGRAARRDEYDPRRAVAAVDALAERARERRAALEDEVAARASLPEERSSARDALLRARETLTEYARAYSSALDEWGPAALEGAASPEELSADLRRAEGDVERAERAQAAGRFAEARGLLREAAGVARDVMQAPRTLKAATAEADRKKREGEEKLKELEARLAQAKANEHMMDPYQRQRLREYEYNLQNARYGFFGSDWLTALLVFEALDTDYMYVGDPFMGGGFGDGGWGDGGDWGGGDFGDGGGWGGGDFGGGDFGGGDF